MTQNPPATVGPASVSTVEQHLAADASLKKKLGPRDTPVPRRNNDGVINFPKFAVDLTHYIVAKGEQPLHLKGNQVADHARRFIDEQDELAREQAAADAASEVDAEALTPSSGAPDTNATPAVNPPLGDGAPEAVAPVVAAPQPAKRRGRRTKAEMAAAAAAASSNAGVPPASLTATSTVAASESAPVSATVPAAPKADPAAAIVQKAPGETDPRVSVGFAIYCLLHGADVLAERDTLPGSEKRRAQLLSTLAAYRPFSTP